MVENSKLFSISDDDICSECIHCHYNPGGESLCKLDWPGEVNRDGYILACKRFKNMKKYTKTQKSHYRIMWENMWRQVRHWKPKVLIDEGFPYDPGMTNRAITCYRLRELARLKSEEQTPAQRRYTMHLLNKSFGF